MLVCVSTGVLYPHTTDINEQIGFFKKSGLEIDGIEISPGRPVTPGITKENEAYFKKLQFNSMHLPWKDITYSGDENPAVIALSELCRRLDCRVAVIHPDCVNNIEIYESLQSSFPGFLLKT